MAHKPHLFLPGPWVGDGIEPNLQQQDHLGRVLRRSPGAPVTYTDGAGTAGHGTWDGRMVVRGAEISTAVPSPAVHVAVAPPRSKDRARFLVEKLAELGVDELRWLKTRFGQGSPPGHDKALAWAIGALEQSRGSWLMNLAGLTTIDELDGVLLIADITGSGGVPREAARYTIVIGPEGGLRDDEFPSQSVRLRLSSRVLRTETAAVVAAALVLKELDR